VPFVGSNIEYLNVTELEDTSGVGGKTEFSFLASSDEGGNNAQPYIAALNTSWRVGAILSEKNYKFDNGIYSLVRETNNGYYIGEKEKITNGIKVDYSAYSTVNSTACREHSIGMSTLFTESFYLNQSVTKEYLGDTINNVTNISATSSNHTLPTLTEKFDSKGNPVKEITVYSFDYDTSNVVSQEAKAIRNLIRRNILVPIETIQIKAIHDTDYVIGSNLYTYKLDYTVVDKIYSLKLNKPLLFGSFAESSINNGSGNFVKDSRYELRISENKYDSFGNIVEQQKASDSKMSYIWDYKKYFPVAEIANADSASVSYTSFEADGTGNWNIGNSNRDTSQSITGHNSYQLSNGDLTKSGLSSSTEYLLSYWTKNSNAFSITGTQGTAQKGKTINGWTCFVHKIKGISSVSLSGTGIIDEVRLYPWSAQMTTFTYDPLIGVTSQCDTRNSLIYYEYDGFGRLKLIRDQDKNILKSFNYKYQVHQ
jgi:YD repeat-containing protein